MKNYGINMKLWDYHIHSRLCRHAKGNLEEYVKAAINKNLSEIGFSEHIPYEYLPISPNIPREEYGMPEKELQYYFTEIERLQAIFKDEIVIKTGMEVDYFEWSENEVIKFLEQYRDKWDYIIGSIHMIDSPNFGIWPVDDNRYSKYSEIGVDDVYYQYIEQLASLIETGEYDILGHIDLPKKNGNRPQNTKRYYLLMENLLDKIKTKEMAVELNTAGARKPIEEYYPDKEILRIISEKKIPMIISSDAHSPMEVGYDFNNAVALLEKNDVTNLCKFTKRKKELVKLNDLI
ncbi:MAG: histidinol-phosphatase HisJ [Candidatus Lokiarchaeota archaeon]|nr:histidinol-phosphatase HisJ [Candidatus Lokiarchaeota archaeon]